MHHEKYFNIFNYHYLKHHIFLEIISQSLTHVFESEVGFCEHINYNERRNMKLSTNNFNLMVVIIFL